MVYRAYDASGRLLYIGSTRSLKRRIGQHKARSPWAAEIARVWLDGPGGEAES